MFAKNDKYINLILSDPNYDVRSDGTIWTRMSKNGAGVLPNNQWKICKTLSGAGYYFIWYKLRKGSRSDKKANLGVRVPTHRVVYLKFIGKLDENLVINHKNGIKTDNAPENLELVTEIENCNHAIETLKNSPIKNNKIDFDIADEIRAAYKQGATNKQLREKYGLSKSNVSFIVNNKTWVKQKYNSEEYK